METFQRERERENWKSIIGRVSQITFVDNHALARELTFANAFGVSYCLSGNWPPFIHS